MNLSNSQEIYRLVLVIANGIAIAILFLCILYIWSRRQKKKIQEERRFKESAKNIKEINEKMSKIVNNIEANQNKKVKKICMKEKKVDRFDNKVIGEKELREKIKF